MNNNDEFEKFRRVADVWIIVLTVFLALEFSAVNFTIDYFLEKNHSIEIYIILSLSTVIPMGLGLVIFLAAREPRMKKYPLPTLIDRGVLSVYVSTIIGSILLGYGVFEIANSLKLGMVVFGVIAVIITIVYVGFYRRLIHGQKN